MSGFRRFFKFFQTLTLEYQPVRFSFCSRFRKLTFRWWFSQIVFNFCLKAFSFPVFLLRSRRSTNSFIASSYLAGCFELMYSFTFFQILSSRPTRLSIYFSRASALSLFFLLALWLFVQPPDVFFLRRLFLLWNQIQNTPQLLVNI